MFDEHARHGEAVEYGASNPHPLFGKDPNILNEKGHTKYPMHVDHPTEKDPRDAKGRFPLRVIVQDEDEHNELLGKSKKKAEWAGK